MRRNDKRLIEKGRIGRKQKEKVLVESGKGNKQNRMGINENSEKGRKEEKSKNVVFFYVTKVEKDRE